MGIFQLKVLTKSINHIEKYQCKLTKFKEKFFAIGLNCNMFNVSIEYNTNVKIEIMADITTFIDFYYIIASCSNLQLCSNI